jgi:hypothetical protein
MRTGRDCAPNSTLGEPDVSGYGTTVEQRVKQEINLIASAADLELKRLRGLYLDMRGRQGKPPILPLYYLRRMQIVLHDAGNKMAAVEQHWLHRRDT